MLQLQLTFDYLTDGHPAPPPTACPRSGCGGGRVRHWQTVAKPVRGSAGGSVTAERYICLDCRRTFRVYPQGIDRGTVPAAAKHWAAALHDLGLPCRDVSRALAVLGAALGKSRVQTLARPLVGAGRPRPGWLSAVLERVEIEGEDMGEGDGNQVERRAWVWIQGRRHALRRVVDACGRATLVVDGVARDLFHVVDAWAGAMLAEHGVHAAVVYVGDADRRRDGAPLGIVVGGFGWDDAVRAADGAQESGLGPVEADTAAVAATDDHDGVCPNPSGVPFGEPPGHPPVLRPTSVTTGWGSALRRLGHAPGVGIGAGLGAPAPRVGRARHRSGCHSGHVLGGSGGVCHAFGGARRPRVAA